MCTGRCSKMLGSCGSAYSRSSVISVNINQAALVKHSWRLTTILILLPNPILHIIGGLMRNQIVRMYEVYKASAHPNRWVPKTLEKFFFILLEFSLSSSSLAILVLITLNLSSILNKASFVASNSSRSFGSGSEGTLWHWSCVSEALRSCCFWRYTFFFPSHFIFR